MLTYLYVCAQIGPDHLRSGGHNCANATVLAGTAVLSANTLPMRRCVASIADIVAVGVATAKARMQVMV